jgi:hypothetical protein
MRTRHHRRREGGEPADVQAIAAGVNADAAANGDPYPQHTALLAEANDIGGVDVGFLVRRDRVQIADVR